MAKVSSAIIKPYSRYEFYESSCAFYLYNWSSISTDGFMLVVLLSFRMLSFNPAKLKADSNITMKCLSYQKQTSQHIICMLFSSSLLWIQPKLVNATPIERGKVEGVMKGGIIDEVPPAAVTAPPRELVKRRPDQDTIGVRLCSPGITTMISAISGLS